MIPRALVAQFFHEANSFNPTVTRAEDFAQRRGAEMIEHLSGSGTIVGGIIDECQRRKIEVIPIVAANAVPSGPVDHHFFESLCDEIIEAVLTEQPDMILLELHGASLTLRENDPEGELLGRIRNAVGENTVVAVGLDLHAHVTEAMLQAATLITACKHNPHSDFYQTGVKVTELAQRVYCGELNPNTSVARVPMLLSGNTETHAGPLFDAHAIAREALANHADLVDVSIFNCHPFIDVVNPAQVILTIANAAEPYALNVSRSVAELIWYRRSEFINHFPSIETVLETITENPQQRPYVVSDYGDRTLAGATGDSAAILQVLLNTRSTLTAAIPIVAPDLVGKAQILGEGATIEAKVGGLIWHSFERISISGKVVSLGNGDFTIKGPMLAGQPTSVGSTAVIDMGSVRLIAITEAGYTHDVGFFESVGIEVKDYDFVVVKSGNHFQLSFQDIATAIKADTPGIGTYRPGQFKVSRNPVFPEPGAMQPVIESHFVRR